MSVGSPANGFYPDRTANIGRVKDLFVRWTSGSSGAVSTVKNFGEIVSVTQTGTGAYTIQFSQAYALSVNLTGCITQASYNASTGACRFHKVVDANEAANGTLKIVTTNEAGTATDPTTGDDIQLCYQVATDTCFP